MPVRSSNSSVLVWPDRTIVDRAVRAWAAAAAARRGDVRRIGYFGSYARGDWGVGSDLDLVAIVDAAVEPFEFEQVYGAWFGQNVLSAGKQAVRYSVRRYLHAISPREQG